MQINKYVWCSSANFTWTGSWWSSSPSPSLLQWTAWPRRGMDSEWNGLTHQRWKHDASPVETLTSSAEGKPPRKESPPFWSRVMSDRSHQRKWNIKWCQIEEIEEGETPAKINAPMKVSRLNCWYVCLQSEQADVSTTRSVQELVKVVKVRFQDGSFPQFLAPIFYLSPLQVDWMNTTQLNGTRCVLFSFQISAGSQWCTCCFGCGQANICSVSHIQFWEAWKSLVNQLPGEKLQTWYFCENSELFSKSSMQPSWE